MENNIVNTPEFTQAAWNAFNDIRIKDASTAGHCLRVAEYTEAFAKKQGFPEGRVQELYYSALLHDYGKIKIPDNILKSTKKLTKEERTIINSHSDLGAQSLTGILAECEFLKNGMTHHHTSYNPNPEHGGMIGGHISNLQGDDIPEEGRLIAVADVFDALYHARSYKKERTLDEVCEILEDDPRLDQSIVADFIPFAREYAAEKDAIEQIQAQTIYFEDIDERDKDTVKNKSSHLLDDKIGDELRKQIDIFNEIEDKSKYITPTQEEIAILQHNTALREMVRRMPIAHDPQGNKYDPIPICDESGKIFKVNYYSEADGKKIGGYDITAEDTKRIIKGISNAVAQYYSVDITKSATDVGIKDNMNKKTSDDIDIDL